MGARAIGAARLRATFTQNWRGTPLTSVIVAIELIANTTTKTGLTIRCELDAHAYPKGIKVSDEEMATLNLTRDPFHPRMELRYRAEKFDLMR